MYRQESQAAYKAASVDTETQIGLLLVSYEALAVHLSRAAEAAERLDIPARCEASNRALSLLGHIESWVTYLEDPLLIASLSEFYPWLRRRIVLSQITASKIEFQSLAEVVLNLRATWQEKKEQLSQEAKASAGLSTASAGGLKPVTWYV